MPAPSQPGSDYQFPVKIYSPTSGDLADPDSITIELWQSDDDIYRRYTAANDAVVTRTGVGLYTVSGTVPLDFLPGQWFRVDVRAAFGSVIESETFFNEQLVACDPCGPAHVEDSASVVACDQLAVVRPVLPRVDGAEVPQGRLGVLLVQGQEATLEWTFRDAAGRPINLRNCVGSSSGSSAGSSSSGEDDGGFRAVFRESLSEAPNPLAVATGAVQSAQAGTVRFQIPGDVVDKNGVMTAELAVMAPSGRPRLVNTAYLIIDRSSFSATELGYRRRGVPMVAELRTFLLDRSAADNYLLATIEHELGEVAYAMIQAVSDWNSFMPGIGPSYSTSTFVDPETLVEGVVGYLLLAAAHNYRRNYLAYQAAGVAVADKNKEGAYAKAGQEYLAMYTKWVRTQKVRANKENWSGKARSPYVRTLPRFGRGW